ncbi:MAG: hypothetical protein ACFFDT_11595, partial [Candidatus Hodarchaeota archaeon]
MKNSFIKWLKSEMGMGETEHDRILYIPAPNQVVFSANLHNDSLLESYLEYRVDYMREYSSIFSVGVT